MKNYPNIISKLFYEPLVITKAKHFAIWKVLEARLCGQALPFTVPSDDDDEEEKPDWESSGPDAIIPVHGILGKHLSTMEMVSGGCDVDCIGAMIDGALRDSEVKRLVFDFNSPGGSVTGLPELGRKIAGITTKETIAFTDSECCSGALWLATQCQKFYATESSNVGSIGVWCAYLDLSRQMANEGQNMQEISAGKYKTMGAYWKPLTTEERAMIQGQVDKIYAQFKDAVNLRREVDAKHMEGQIFDGIEAVEIGLVDGVIDSLDEVLN
jgi:signal peptide peptidase SppA